ncbi:phosphohistidine phosphatase SixA [Erwinia sp. OLTSP20]|uniref:phosphohistidine phosphatase SixA n=1 Tax=unclassified Erwinia TaxID=2622719 RepID=UPI000C180394|nr:MULTISPECIES: phosphohistidine phosphatase SixA [unclassified Erwinia]PIJ51525.1 phosphohistidine phosphatase SixA [Erwinia sp. OAMSP11]PIJ75888.1 phosphohistidine phosphatase SixA [Erwinia sp. OLSSP12]PIJ83436.1 phosphohistidine phosphatase SixA [Erwinia sp. OLCASP19]PIJ86269.1 phosphohistidine phosphatase SixA [Erwinia sp. OLMTSP26]PIJ88488.1 phosphohistidine phosphatase SixA [Erwinia sp. OLMDSP33]
MQVFIMRHGDAALDAASDPVRPLTHCGCDESRQMASWLKNQSVSIERVLVSPYLRAEQTQQMVREVLSLPEGQEVLPELTPDGDATQVASYLQTLAAQGISSVMVISHLPLVGYLVSELCPQETPPMFATSAIACVDYDPVSAQGQLLWQVSPSKLAKAM